MPQYPLTASRGLWSAKTMLQVIDAQRIVVRLPPETYGFPNQMELPAILVDRDFSDIWPLLSLRTSTKHRAFHHRAIHAPPVQSIFAAPPSNLGCKCIASRRYVCTSSVPQVDSTRSMMEGSNPTCPLTVSASKCRRLSVQWYRVEHGLEFHRCLSRFISSNI